MIEDDAFLGLNHLSSLTLNYCGLKEVPPLGPVRGNLKILHLSSNCLIVIPEDYFCGFTRLQSISLDSNKLLAVTNITPIKSKLTHLELDGNQIPSFDPFLMHTTFPTMRQLNVHNDKITYLSRDMISWWPKLMILHLRNNLLKSLENLSGLIRAQPASLMIR